MPQAQIAENGPQIPHDSDPRFPYQMIRKYKFFIKPLHDRIRRDPSRQSQAKPAITSARLPASRLNPNHRKIHPEWLRHKRRPNWSTLPEIGRVIAGRAPARAAPAVDMARQYRMTQTRTSISATTGQNGGDNEKRF
ncbi:MAG: hypothetical protein KIT13_06615 [Burkholderiales bacterium]|nr:hypothetical protein [Burkholderiales bacterium]MCW5604306.1 hypothetical protein [Burkholderiales bacterium]